MGLSPFSTYSPDIHHDVAESMFYVCLVDQCWSFLNKVTLLNNHILEEKTAINMKQNTLY
jgi:hypothetical protein